MRARQFAEKHLFVSILQKMNKEDILLLYEYDRSANNRVFQAVSALSAEQFTHDLGREQSFRARRATAHHRRRVGLACLLEGAVPQRRLLDEFEKTTRRPVQSRCIPQCRRLQKKWEEVEKEQAEFVDNPTNETLGKMIPFRSTQVRRMHLIDHLANHSTYYRGQVALMMRPLGAEPVATDFHVFLVEGRREAAP